METKYKMHLVPTEKYSDLVITKGKYGGLFNVEHYGSPDTKMGDSYQILFITSNEELEAGDLGINLATNSIFEVIESTPSEYGVKFITGGNISNRIVREEWSHALPAKIIASTDKSLTPKSWINFLKNLWILRYYNQNLLGNKELPGSDLWELEMDEIITGQCNCPCHGEDAMIMHIMACCHPQIHYKPKTNSDGSIIIKRKTTEVERWENNGAFDDKPNPNEIPKDYKEITGFDTPAELAAYEKGRDHEQRTIVKWIEKWDGSTNSVMGQLLHDKLKELK